MKNIFKTSILALVLVAMGSCENDQDPIAIAGGGPTLLTPTNGTSVVLKPESPNVAALILVWDYSSAGVATAANYVVEAAETGSDFADPIILGSTTSRFLTLTAEEFNGLLTPARFAPFTESQLDIRVRSVLGTAASAMTQMSNVITIKVTPYSTELPKIGVPGNHQGWDPTAPDLPILRSSSFTMTDYEGYVWLDGEYKFLAPMLDGSFDWGTTDWGDDGSFSGMLAVGGGNASAPAGYYLLKADTTTLLYSQTPTNWGIIGNATPTGWDSDTDMTYDPATKTLSIVMNLVADGNKIKFRANDAWELNFGDNGADGTLEQGGDDIAVPATGMYKITLDLSQPRAYTYSLTPQ